MMVLCHSPWMIEYRTTGWSSSGGHYVGSFGIGRRVTLSELWPHAFGDVEEDENAVDDTRWNRREIHAEFEFDKTYLSLKNPPRFCAWHSARCWGLRDHYCPVQKKHKEAHPLQGWGLWWCLLWWWWWWCQWLLIRTPPLLSKYLGKYVIKNQTKTHLCLQRVILSIAIVWFQA